MPGRVDILASDISVVGQSDFVADSSVTDLAVNNTAGAGLVFANAAGETYFDLGDHLLCQKIWSVINWGFGQGGYNASRAHNIGIVYWDGAAAQVINPPFNNTIRSINLPLLCCPLEFGDGLYMPMPITGTRRQLRLFNIDLRISQVNLPGVFDGVRFHVQYFMQVLHTQTMKVVP